MGVWTIRTAAVLAALFFATSTRAAVGISIWDLTGDAELIVLARVDATQGGSKVKAYLEVLEVWKGNAPEPLVVTFAPGMRCPEPAVYEEGTHVVAFLSRYEGDWSTRGDFYGLRKPSTADIPVLRDAVHGALAARASGLVEDERVWHVRAAARRATRLDGLFGIAGAESFFSFKPHRHAASEAERLAIAEGFAIEPLIEYSVVPLLRLVGRLPHPRFDATLAAVLDRVWAHHPNPYYASEATLLMLYRLGLTDIPPDPDPSRWPTTVVWGDMPTRWRAARESIAAFEPAIDVRSLSVSNY